MTVRAPTVILPHHAYDRYLERWTARHMIAGADEHEKPLTHSQLVARLEAKLATYLAVGAKTVGLFLELPIGGGLKAELGLTDRGWVTISVFDVSMELREKKGAV
jgi:hypothetical protein